MNEQIKQFWEEAAKITGDSWEEQPKFMETFAELIVWDCVEIIEMHRIPIRPGRSGEMAAKWTVDELRECQDKIKKHFGVEP